MKPKFISTITGAAILVAVLSFFSKSLGFIREILFANYFGLGHNYDLYLIGAVLPITINTITLNIAINYFIPSYHKKKQESANTLNHFFSSSFWLFTICGFITSVALYYLAPYLFSFYVPDVSAKEFSTIIFVFDLLLISVPINAGTSIFISYLQAEYKFKEPAFSQIIINIFFIGLLVALTGTTGIITIPIAYIAGMIAQWIYLIRYCPRPTGFLLSKLTIAKVKTKNLIILLPIILIETIGQLYFLSDRYFYNSIDAGGIAALNYSFNLFMLPVTIMSFALTTVLFPRFAQTLSSGNNEEFYKNFIQSLEVTLLIFIPITILFILSGNVIIHLLFERGNFNSDATAMTFSVLKIYSLSLPIYAVYAILNKIIYGARKVNYLLTVTFIAILLKVVVNFLLVERYQQEGLAMATVFSYIFFFLSSILIIYRNTGKEPFVLMLKTLIIILLSVLLSFYISGKIGALLIENHLYQEVLAAVLFIIIYYISLTVTKQNVIVSIHKLLFDLIKKYSLSGAK